MKRTRDAIETKLSKGGSIVVIYDALPIEDVKQYRSEAEKVDRVQSLSSFGHLTPRLQKHYHPEKKPYVYSRITHQTTEYPEHVNKMLDVAESKLSKWIDECKRRDHAVDIEYSDKLKQGGSISPHSDDEDQWTAVLIYTVGQTRSLVIRDKASKRIVHKVMLCDNSLVLMNGIEVQKHYTHSVPKLGKDVQVETRYSLNVRYK